MSLYKESQSTIEDLKDAVSKVKESKAKLNSSADSMTTAINAFVDIAKPLHVVVAKNLDLEKIINEQMTALLGRLDEIKTDSISQHDATTRVNLQHITELRAALVSRLDELKNDSIAQYNETTRVNLEHITALRTVIVKINTRVTIMACTLLFGIIGAGLTMFMLT